MKTKPYTYTFLGEHCSSPCQAGRVSTTSQPQAATDDPTRCPQLSAGGPGALMAPRPYGRRLQLL
jgi:hypothetical protein